MKFSFISGKPIKRKSWKGYWEYKYGKIKMHTHDGLIIDFTDTKDILFTISNLFQDDWVFATKDNCKVLKEEIDGRNADD